MTLISTTVNSMAKDMQSVHKQRNFNLTIDKLSGDACKYIGGFLSPKDFVVLSGVSKSVNISIRKYPTLKAVETAKKIDTLIHTKVDHADHFFQGKKLCKLIREMQGYQRRAAAEHGSTSSAAQKITKLIRVCIQEIQSTTRIKIKLNN